MAVVPKGERIDWISVVRGMTIFFVILYHAQLYNPLVGQSVELSTGLNRFMTPCRMPLFIFSSGCLLQLTRIRKSWPVGKMYKDKAERLLVPFVFFATVYFFVKGLLHGIVKSPIPLSIGEYLKSLIFCSGSAETLWFLPIIFEMMLLYPLYIWLEKKNIRMIVFLLLLCVFYFADFSQLNEYNAFYILKLNKYLVFFFFGIFFFNFKLYNYINHVVTFLTLLVAYVAVFYLNTEFFELRLLLLNSFIGILLFVSGSIIVSKYVPSLFSSFRDYIYQIYLMSLLFQGFVELVLWQRIVNCNMDYYYLFFAINILAGIYIPVVIALCVKKIPVRFVRICFGLK